MATLNNNISASGSRTKTEHDKQGKVNAFDEKIVPFLWFNGNAEEAMKFYLSAFKNSKTLGISRYGENGPGQKDTVMSASFKLEGQSIIALNGGPEFSFTPSNSFYVSCKTLPEIKKLWNKLAVGGSVLMELDKYSFSKKYGWLQDKFGVSWQLILSESTTNITPFLMFSGKYQGMAEEAIHFYTSTFRNSGILNVTRYNEQYPGPTGKVVHAEFKINGQKFIAMDSAIEMQFTFTPAISYFVYCKTQKEVDDYWEKLSDGGSVMQCGWLSDKFGVTWQIVPTILMELMNDPDRVKAGRVMNAMMQMVKLDIKGLKDAYNDHS